MLPRTTFSDPHFHRLYVIYNEPIPPVQVCCSFPSTAQLIARHSQIEIVPAGEEGPRNLDTTTIMAIKGVPFLSVTEFIRAKLRVWMS